MGQDVQWRILAEEAAQEKDPERLMEIIASLTRALDERAAKKNGNGNGAKRGLKKTAFCRPTNAGLIAA